MLDARGARPEWAKRIGGPGVVGPDGRSNATQYLEPGSYAWVCFVDVPHGIPHIMSGMSRPFVVADTDAPPAPVGKPEADVVVRLVEYDFELSQPISPGPHTIRVQNRGAQPHEVNLLKLDPGKTIEDLQAWLTNPQGPPPGKAVGGLGALGPDGDAYFEAELTPGDYALVCFVSAPDGQPHVAHGMVRQFRVG